MFFHVFLYQGPPRRIAAVIQELEGSLRNGTHQILRSWSPRKKSEKNMSGVNFGYGKKCIFYDCFHDYFMLLNAICSYHFEFLTNDKK